MSLPEVRIASVYRWVRAALPLLVALAIVSLDQATKAWVTGNLEYGQSIPLVPALDGWVNVVYSHNSGAVFGILPQANYLFMLIAIVVVVVILVLYRYMPIDGLLVRAGLGLQLGGALGNLVDRLRFGYVIDFLDAGVSPSLRWFTFNVADSALVVGVAVLGYYLLIASPGAHGVAESGKQVISEPAQQQVGE